MAKRGKGRREKKGRITPEKQKAKNIRLPKEMPESHISFSFGFFDFVSSTAKKKFAPTLCQPGYIQKLLERLKDVSGMTPTAFKQNRSDALRSHPIPWEKSTEKQGFSHLPSEHQAAEAWQFALTRNAHGRVHGFFIGSVFQVVWIDPEHHLLPGGKR